MLEKFFIQSCLFFTICCLFTAYGNSFSQYGESCYFKKCINDLRTFCNSSHRCDCHKKYIYQNGRCVYNLRYCDELSRCYSNQHCDFDIHQCVCNERFEFNPRSGINCYIKKGFCDSNRIWSCRINEFCNMTSWHCDCQHGFERNNKSNDCIAVSGKNCVENCPTDRSKFERMSRSEKLGWIIGGSFGIVTILSCCFGGYIGYAIKEVKKDRMQNTCLIQICMDCSDENKKETNHSHNECQYEHSSIHEEESTFQSSQNANFQTTTTEASYLASNFQPSAPSFSGAECPPPLHSQPTKENSPPPYFSLFTKK